MLADLHITVIIDIQEVDPILIILVEDLIQKTELDLIPEANQVGDQVTIAAMLQLQDAQAIPLIAEEILQAEIVQQQPEDHLLIIQGLILIQDPALHTEVLEVVPVVAEAVIEAAAEVLVEEVEDVVVVNQ